MLNIGYDSPKLFLSEDELDRRRLALDLSELIRSTPADISARIGVFGRWGSGKSTVLEMIASILEERGYVIVRFNPATSESFSDLVAQFADKLVSAFIAYGLYVEPFWKKWLRKGRALFSSRTTTALVDGLGELHSGAKLANAGLAMIATWLKPNGDQARRLRQALPESRVLVLIDDLDRCPSSLLPKLLLSLRDVLDIERFTFVLAFDEDIVAKALEAENSAWDNGYSFLEKILDFRVLLPNINSASSLRLLQAEISSRAPHIPVGPEQEIADLLPSNPRRIKALTRSVVSLRSVIARHNAGEFSWVDVWLVELLRQESSLAVDKLSDESVFQNICGLMHRMMSHARTRGESHDQQDPEKEFLVSLKLPDQASEMRVRTLLEAIRGRGTNNIDYVMRFASRAPAITWKEFHECLAAWRVLKQPSTLEHWLKQHTMIREDSIARVVDEFNQALSNYLSEEAEKASRKIVLTELNTAYNDLLPVLDCVRDLFQIESFATSERLSVHYSRAQYWVGANRAGSEATLRERERETLVLSAQVLPNAEKLRFLEQLRPWSYSAEPFFDEARARSSRTLLEDISLPLIEEAYVRLLVRLTSADMLKSLRENGRQATYKALLFSPQFLPWREDLARSVVAILRGDVAAVNSYDFGLELLRIWTDVLGYKLDISRGGVVKLITDDEVVRFVWEAVQRPELMERGNIVLLAYRERLIRDGANSTAMPTDTIPASMIKLFEDRKEELLQSV